jgi:hypothetical protein
MPDDPIVLSLPVDMPQPVARTDGAWGITTTQTTRYDLEGKRLGLLPGGVVVDIQGAITSSAGAMKICRYRRQHDKDWQGPALIAESHLALMSGTPDDAPEATLELLRVYFETRGMIDARTAELAGNQMDANPHSAEYRRLYQQLTALEERTKKLTEQRDQATGEARMRAIDALRVMKDEQAELNRNLKQVQTQYRAWKARPGAVGIADPAADPQIQTWKRRLSLLEPEVRKVIPSL